MSDKLDKRRTRAKIRPTIEAEEISRRGSRIRLGDASKGGFASERFPHVQKVAVEFEDGSKFIDDIKGLNRGHALSRASANWPSARRIVALGAKVGKAIRPAAKLLGKVAGNVGPPDVRKIVGTRTRKFGSEARRKF